MCLGQKPYTVDYKLETYLKIARLYLEDEDPVQASILIIRPFVAIIYVVHYECYKKPFLKQNSIIMSFSSILN